MTSKLSQKDYLKKYLSSDSKLKKRSKKSKDKPVKSSVKIIDDDEYAYNAQDNEIDENDLYALNEEAPQIVGVIDERAPDVLMKQEYIQSGKWKQIGSDAKSNAEKQKKQDSSPPDESPPRRKRRNSDESPPRRRNGSEPLKTRSPDKSKRRDSDASPPRKSRRDSDASPPRRSRRDSDNSPPRRQGKLTRTSQQRRNSDESPPRRKDTNMSRKRNDSSPPRKSRMSPRRNSRDKSPPRHRRSRWSPEVKRERESPKRRGETPPTSSRMTKTLDGKISGLQDAKTLKRENDKFKERQEKLFQEMQPELSGRNAELKIRDRRGRNKEFEQEVESERKKTEAEEARKKVYDRWGKGVKQVEDIQKRYEEHVHEANKPLARSADDSDLQDHLRNLERIDDPMLGYFRKKKLEDDKKKGLKEKPKYIGQFPDNRYYIGPGYRWDGVDRSNGYEKKYFSMINSKKSQEEEAYRYSTEDM